MSVPVVKACFIAGSPRSSGDVQDGGVSFIRGGGRSQMKMSGIIAGDQLLQSGAGRLNSILVINSLQSGQPVIFYDSAVATSGGPFATSGHKVVGVIPAVWREGASGVINTISAPGSVIPVDFPFQSGLCAAAVSSGTPGFAISYTLEVNSNFPSA